MGRGGLLLWAPTGGANGIGLLFKMWRVVCKNGMVACMRALARTKSRMAASPRSSPLKSHTKRAWGTLSLRERRKRPSSLHARRPTPSLIQVCEYVNSRFRCLRAHKWTDTP